MNPQENIICRCLDYNKRGKGDTVKNYTILFLLFQMFHRIAVSATVLPCVLGVSKCWWRSRCQQDEVRLWRHLPRWNPRLDGREHSGVPYFRLGATKEGADVCDVPAVEEIPGGEPAISMDEPKEVLTLRGGRGLFQMSLAPLSVGCMLVCRL